MRRIIILAVILLINKIGIAQNKSITITGTIAGLEKPTLAKLFQVNGYKTDTLATTNIIKGKFNFRLTNKSEPTFYFLKIDGLMGAVTLFLNSGNVEVSGSAMQWTKVSIKGSASHKDYEVYHYMVDSLEQQGQELSTKLSKALQLQDSLTIAELDKHLKRIISEYEQRQRDFVKTHSDSFYAPIVINNAKWHWLKKRELFRGLSVRVKDSKYGLTLAKNLVKWKKESGLLEVNDTIPGFIASNSNGKNIEVKEAIKSNKLTLIDFWASWCSPCREENPLLVKTYNQNKKNGFDILGISLDEKDADWKQAILKDGLLWEQVSDLKGWASPITKQYLAGMPFNFIPQNFLVDANGKILARNLRGDALGKMINDLLHK
ncbi:TlpA disulfide reductase family protein [Pedobacter africanus]|uniref:Thiol-disulfide isomerase/thioredoxin n=2 Tax=Pedobacter africanus TaxID=151894 RepID=A0ACC6L1K6_9SPHI|nr:thiol-disulfide isomerase/thioredoxin [Pedobacter africanus]